MCLESFKKPSSSKLTLATAATVLTEMFKLVLTSCIYHILTIVCFT